MATIRKPEDSFHCDNCKNVLVSKGKDACRQLFGVNIKRRQFSIEEALLGLFSYAPHVRYIERY